jgi:RNA binding exosome subunit
MRKFLTFLFLLPLISCAELQQIAEQLPQTTIGTVDISNALKEALNNGISKQVTKLTSPDGFFKNEMVKILLPQELQKVDKTLRDIGLSSLADEGLKVLNRAAEEAVKEATPIFVDAIKQMTFTDARNILMGADNAATTYLQNTTSKALYAKFSPVVNSSLSKVGADQVWSQIITKYNSIPLVNKVNPDLTDYVTTKAMDGVFTMVSVEEKEIRNNVAARTSDLLRKVFALQD